MEDVLNAGRHKARACALRRRYGRSHLGEWRAAGRGDRWVSSSGRFTVTRGRFGAANWRLADRGEPIGTYKTLASAFGAASYRGSSL